MKSRPKTRYMNIEYTPELFDSLLEQSIEESEQQHLSLVVVTPTRNYTIPDPQDFRDGYISGINRDRQDREIISHYTKRKRKRARARKRARSSQCYSLMSSTTMKVS